MRILCVISNATWRNTFGPAVLDGLCTFSDARVVAKCKPEGLRGNDALCVWNGAKDLSGRLVVAAREQGIKTIVAERGFFNRMNYTQIDLEGFNHTASWANDTHTIWGDENRFFKAFGSRPAEQKSRENGYILVLGQVPTDAQLKDSEIRHADVLVELVKNALPPGLEVKLRKHPTIAEPGRSLEDDIRDARFCVTINSNSGNEAIARGCPVLSFHPSLYTMAGVAHETTVATLPDDLQRMLDGYHPTTTDATHYLHALASRQWNDAELREGSVLKRLLEN